MEAVRHLGFFYIRNYDASVTCVLLIAVQSSVVMLPVSIVLAMIFRNIRPRPTQQKLIKDLLVFDVDAKYADIVAEYEQRNYEWDSETFESLSLGSLLSSEQTDGTDNVHDLSASSSSSSSDSDADDRPTEDEFVTPKETSASMTPARRHSDNASVAIQPETASDHHTQFSTAVESDFGTYTGPLPWWVGIITWSFAIAVALASAFFIILYTFTFGYEKSKSFLISVLTSFFVGLLMEQPVKVLLVAFALAFIFRKSTDIYPTEMDIVADHSVRGTLHHVNFTQFRRCINCFVCLLNFLPHFLLSLYFLPSLFTSLLLYFLIFYLLLPE